MKRLCNRPGVQRFVLGSAYTLLALIIVPMTLLTLWGGINIVFCRMCQPPSEQEIVRAVQSAAEKPGTEGTNRARR
jgi:hypothetical protein